MKNHHNLEIDQKKKWMIFEQRPTTGLTVILQSRAFTVDAESQQSVPPNLVGEVENNEEICYDRRRLHANLKHFFPSTVDTTAPGDDDLKPIDYGWNVVDSDYQRSQGKIYNNVSASAQPLIVSLPVVPQAIPNVYGRGTGDGVHNSSHKSGIERDNGKSKFLIDGIISFDNPEFLIEGTCSPIEYWDTNTNGVKTLYESVSFANAAQRIVYGTRIPKQV